MNQAQLWQSLWGERTTCSICTDICEALASQLTKTSPSTDCADFLMQSAQSVDGLWQIIPLEESAKE
jgi:hypothetical protein